MTNYVKPFRCVIQRVLTVTALSLSVLLSPTSLHAEELPKVLFQTNLGSFQVTLRPDLAPKTVNNFLQYVEDDFYNGLIFHRVIPGFMVQGGGFDSNLNRQNTRSPIPNEAKPTAGNLRGTIAMARTQNPDSATSQFFVNLTDNGFLNAGARGPGYAVFGKVTEGMGVIDAIAQKPTGRKGGMGDVPLEPIIIQEASIIEQGSD